MISCPSCNAQLPDGSAFCGNCGCAIPSQSAPAPQQGVVPTGANQAGAHQQAEQPNQQFGQQPYQQPYQQSSQYQSGQQYYQQSSQAQPGQQAYQQPSYSQPQYVAQQSWSAPDDTNRAYAMILYLTGLFGIIIALLVRDRSNAFITHHLNNAVVIFIGLFIGGLLSIILIGFILILYLLVMTIMGIVSAYNGEQKELPLIGKIHIVK